MTIKLIEKILEIRANRIKTFPDRRVYETLWERGNMLHKLTRTDMLQVLELIDQRYYESLSAKDLEEEIKFYKKKELIDKFFNNQVVDKK